MAFPDLYISQDPGALLSGSDNDAVILVSSQKDCAVSKDVESVLHSVAAVDKRLGKDAMLIHAPEIAGNRLIHAPTGPLSHDYDDVRNFSDAAAKGIVLAKESGAINPVLLVEGIPEEVAFENAIEVSFLGACQALWQPLEAREILGEETVEPVKSITILDMSDRTDAFYLSGLEAGRRLARDLAGTEPERMSPPNFADYCLDAMAGSPVSVEVIDDQAKIAQDFPLLATVGRASQTVPRHQPRLVKLYYEGDGPIEQTLFIVGKAVTFDTGGVDIKTGGHMAGMSRDKGGAAAVAGFMKAVAELRPTGLKVVAFLAAVRNSVGADAFVSDEIVTSHAGVRVRIANTDAEGRLAMTDSLSHCRLMALEAENPELMTIATLTGHAAISVGPYTALVENGTARHRRVSQYLADAGDSWGDCMEINRSRREDWHTNRARSRADDVLSANNGPSVGVPRGHQFPMAFMSKASGLDEHGVRSEHPLAYLHIDIAGSSVEGGDWQHGKPTAAPVTALAARYLKQ
ncbi:MAG: leucyl aminopeptidase family protein [Gammaproteobacteria bacterium]|nr:leucyl aminopeptidase family protein [Chromatiales bacterium]MYE49729.1 leucyl aminopeptidase family protein [Gammaproteobacteria bacterium]